MILFANSCFRRRISEKVSFGEENFGYLQGDPLPCGGEGGGGGAVPG